MLGPGVINITLAVAVIYIPTYFRLTRGQTLTIKEELYVEAAEALGVAPVELFGLGDAAELLYIWTQLETEVRARVAGFAAAIVHAKCEAQPP